MTNTTATMRQDRVLSTIADLESVSVYVHDLVTQLDPGVAASIKIANYSDPTLNTTFGTTAAASAPTKAEFVISVDQERWTNELIDRADEVLDLNGTAIDELTKKHVRYARQQIEKDVLVQLSFASGISSSSADTFNQNASTLATADWRGAQAALASNLGIMPQNMMFVLDPFAAAGVRELGTFELDKTVTGGSNILGVRQVGVLDGVPAFESQALVGGSGNRRSYAATIVSGAASSGFTTASIGANHGLLATMPVSIQDDGGDPDGVNTGSFGITSITETTVIVPVSSSLLGNSETTVRLEACVNLLIAKDHAYFAPKFMLDPKFVDAESRHGVGLQVGSLYGRGARASYVKRILSPYASLTTNATTQ